MTNVVSISASQRRLDTENIAFYDDLYKADVDSNTLEFTAEGHSYYGSWFRRFGYKFDGITPHEFFTTVRDINRTLWEQEPVEQQLSSGKLQGDEAAVWTLWVEGRFEEFSQAFVALADKAKLDSHERVVPLKRAADR